MKGLCNGRFTIRCRPVDATRSQMKRAGDRKLGRLSLLAGLLLVADGGNVQSARAADPVDDSSFRFTVSPGVLLTRLNGTSQLGPSPASGSIILESQLDLDDQDAAVGIEFQAEKDELWEVDLSGFDFSTDSRGAFEGFEEFGDLTLNDGDMFKTEFDMLSVAASLAYWPWDVCRIGPTPEGRECRVALRAGPSIGLHYIGIDHSIEIEGEGRERGEGDWLAPVAGLSFELRYLLPEGFPLARELHIDAGMSIGPAISDEIGAMAQLHAGLQLYFTPNIALGFGYRLIELDVQDDDFEFDGGLQGLFFSGTFRF